MLQDRSAGLRISVNIALLVIVLVIAFQLRDLAVNLSIPPGPDEAQYLGLARDYVETGSFAETTHRESIPYFMPLGYPVMTALVMRATGWGPAKAGLALNLILGCLLVLLVYLITWRSTKKIIVSFFVALFAASNQFLVKLSAVALTDTSYMVFTLMIAGLIIEFFNGKFKYSFLPFSIILSVLFCILYQIRISAIYLLPGVPFILVVLNYYKQKVKWSRLAVGLLVFCLIGGGSIFATSYRLYKLNGYWSLSPQVAGNATIGRLITNSEYNLLKLHPSGTTTMRRYIQRHGYDANDKVGGALWQKARSSLVNLLINVEYAWRGIWNEKNVPIGTALFCIALVLLLINRKGLYNFDNNYGKFSRYAVALITLGLIAVGHIFAYSLMLHGRRYMFEILPMLLIIYGISYWYFSRFVISAFGSPYRIVIQNTKKSENILDILVGFKTIIVALTIFFVILLLVNQLKVTKDMVVSRDAIDDSSERYAWRHCGYIINNFASEYGISPRILGDSWTTAYLARGTGFAPPYMEDRPRMILKYLKNKKINFIALQNRITFGPIVTGVPIYYLAMALSKIPSHPMLNINPDYTSYPVFYIKRYVAFKPYLMFKDVKEISCKLQSNKIYLLWAQFLGKPSNGYPMKNLSLFSLKFFLEMPLNADLCPGPNVQENQDASIMADFLLPKRDVEEVVWNMYFTINTKGLVGAELKNSTELIKPPLTSFKRAVLYEVTNTN